MAAPRRHRLGADNPRDHRRLIPDTREAASARPDPVLTQRVVAILIERVGQQRRCDSYHRPIICAASASLAASMIRITYSILLTLPF